MKVTTNNVPRDLVSLAELPAGVAASEFDYVGEDDAYSPRFFRYRGAWYDVHEFVRIVERSRATGWAHGVDDGSPLLAWDGIATDSLFSATLIRYADRDCDSVIVGRID